MKKIRKIIREEIEQLLEDFTFNNNKVFYPPQEVVSACQNALAVIGQNNLTQDGGNEGSGESKARSIVNKEPISHSMLKRMKSFFDNNKIKIDKERSLGKNISNSGMIQSWELWGGDAGMRWSSEEIGKLNQTNLDRKGLRRDSGMIKTSTLMDPTNIRINKKAK